MPGAPGGRAGGVVFANVGGSMSAQTREGKMIRDNAGCSTCPRGGEQWEEFYSELAKGTRVQYDYRTNDGTLYTTVARTLEEARARRDRWLESRKICATA